MQVDDEKDDLIKKLEEDNKALLLKIVANQNKIIQQADIINELQSEILLLKGKDPLEIGKTIKRNLTLEDLKKIAETERENNRNGIITKPQQINIPQVNKYDRIHLAKERTKKILGEF